VGLAKLLVWTVNTREFLFNKTSLLIRRQEKEGDLSKENYTGANLQRCSEETTNTAVLLMEGTCCFLCCANWTRAKSRRKRRC